MLSKKEQVDMGIKLFIVCLLAVLMFIAGMLYAKESAYNEAEKWANEAIEEYCLPWPPMRDLPNRTLPAPFYED